MRGAVVKCFARLFAAMLLLSALGSMAACRREDGSNEKDYILMGETIEAGVAILANGYRYELYPAEGGYSLRTVKADGSGKICYYADDPVCLRIRGAGNKAEKELFARYTSLSPDGNAVVAVAEIETVRESLLRVTDRYVKQGDMLDMTREVTVLRAGNGDEGFASVYSLTYNGGQHDLACMEYFVPGVWNKDTALDHPNGMVSSYDSDTILIKETRTGLPMITSRAITGGETLSIGRPNPVISSDIAEVDADVWMTNENYFCGAVGAILRKGQAPSIAFVYPAAEEPWVYYSAAKELKRFHPIRKDFSSSFTISLRSDATEDYNEAMMTSYVAYFDRMEIDYYDADLDAVYEESLKTVKAYYGTKVTPHMTIYGLPYGCFVKDGHVESDLTMEMGFVGMEISVAYQMMRYGYETGQESYITAGNNMATMWAEHAGTESGVLKVYLLSTGVFHPIPCYLRRMTDGMEGLLDCYNLMQSKGEDRPTWFATVEKYADFLVREQNADGSWYRAYDYGGNVFSDKSVSDYRQIKDIDGIMADSKNSTPIPIRFLVRMYEYTGKVDYLAAAERGAAYVIDTLLPMGKYAGATVDGVERTDKETGIFAMYAMNALYAATGKESYLEAAKQAAIYAASWTATYDYKVADPRITVGGYYADHAVTAGLGLITSGHSTLDGFGAYTYYEYFKLYLWTGEDFYYDFARLVQNNTKRTVNAQGQMGFPHKGLMLEAVNLAEFAFFASGNPGNDPENQTGVWLPWCTVAQIEPISAMEKTFGVRSVEEAATQEREALIAMLEAYGAGGKRWE